MDRASQVRVTGPLGRYAGGFREELLGVGYSPRSAQTHLLFMNRLSRWLDVNGLDPGLLTAACIEQFLIANSTPRWMTTSINRRCVRERGWLCWHLARIQHRSQAGSRLAGR